jgi:hypothetical protein
MEKDVRKGRILIVEFIAFALIAAVIWCDEVLDLPYLFFGLDPSPVNWIDAIFKCALLLFGGALVMFLTWRFMPADAKLKPEQVHMICAVCKKVNKDGSWMSLDEFVESGSSGSFAHGICPDCMETYYKGVTDTTAINFRQHLKKPKA